MKFRNILDACYLCIQILSFAIIMTLLKISCLQVTALEISKSIRHHSTKTYDMAKKLCCLFENSMLGKLLNFFTDLPRVAYKMVAYKKIRVII